jgi:lipid-binding SYLF domain-containing protein
MIRKSILIFCLGLVATASVSAANKEQKRLENAGVVMQEIINTPENIPQEVMEKAECVIVFPPVLKAAFVVGASYGRGAMVCRTGQDFRGPWGAPAMYALEGGSVGFQIGGQATDLVLLVMNNRGVTSILSSKVKLGGDASVAAAPWDARLPQTRMRTCELRFLAIRVRAAFLPAFPSKVPRCGPMTTPLRTSTAASSRQKKSC